MLKENSTDDFRSLVQLGPKPLISLKSGGKSKCLKMNNPRITLFYSLMYIKDIFMILYTCSCLNVPWLIFSSTFEFQSLGEYILAKIFIYHCLRVYLQMKHFIHRDRKVYHSSKHFTEFKINEGKLSWRKSHDTCY